MSDSTFETLFTGQLREYAEAGVRPIDRYAIAEGTIASGVTRTGRLGWSWSPLVRSGRPWQLLLVGLVVLALAASAALVGSRLLAPEPVLQAPEPVLQAPRGYVDELVAARDLSVARLGPLLVQLGDGRVLVIGGDSALETTAELYDSATGTSVAVGAMVSAEAFVASSAMKLPDGRVLVVGDARPFEGPAFAVTQIYDPTTMLFESTSAMATPRAGAQLVALADGRILVTGGTDPVDINTTIASAEIFDPATSTFTKTGDMQMSRQFHASSLLADGRVFLVGGEHATGEGGTMLASAEVYDPVTGTFTTAGAMSGNGGRSIAIALLDGTVLVFRPTLDDLESAGAEIWDPTTGTFHDARGLQHRMTAAAGLDDGRVFLVGVPDRDSTWAGVYDPVAQTTVDIQSPTGWTPTTLRLQDGRVLIVGGLTDGNIRPENGGQLAPAVPTVEIFQVGVASSATAPAAVDPTPRHSDDDASPEPSTASEISIRPAALMVHRNGHTATRLDDGRVLITGGWSGYSAENLARAEIYDPATNTFDLTAAMASRRDGNTATRLSDGRVLVVGGSDASSSAQGSAEVYDPATGRFDAVGSLATPRSGHAAVRLLDGRIAIIGGSNESPGIELYDPATRTFTPGPTDPRLAREGASAVVLDDGRILIVGGFDPLTGSGDPATFAAGVLYDPVSGSLSATAPVRSGPALISPERPIGPAIKLADGSVLIAIEVATGQWGLTRFDPAIGTFTIVGSLDGDPGGRDPVLLSDGRVYFVLQDLERCDRIFGEVFAPETGQVTPGVDVPGIGGCNGGPSPTVTTLADGSVLVAGGKLNGGESTEHASVIRVDP